jgi:hypothetical protein
VLDLAVVALDGNSTTSRPASASVSSCTTIDLHGRGQAERPAVIAGVATVGWSGVFYQA